MYYSPQGAAKYQAPSSKYNLLVQWDDSSVTREPLDIFGKDDPVSSVQYVKDNNLLEEPSWK